MFCKHCQEEVVEEVQIRPDTPHYAEYRCTVCYKHIKWIPKDKQRRQASKVPITIDFCQLCNRNKSNFGINEVLERHHIQQIKDNGLDVAENIWILCTRCHNLIHFLRDLQI